MNTYQQDRLLVEDGSYRAPRYERVVKIQCANFGTFTCVTSNRTAGDNLLLEIGDGDLRLHRADRAGAR